MQGLLLHLLHVLCQLLCMHVHVEYSSISVVLLFCVYFVLFLILTASRLNFTFFIARKKRPSLIPQTKT